MGGSDNRCIDCGHLKESHHSDHEDYAPCHEPECDCSGFAFLSGSGKVKLNQIYLDERRESEGHKAHPRRDDDPGI